MVAKKAVIITIGDPNPNMGNRLQNYAVQIVLEGLGFEVESVFFREKSINWKKYVKKIIHVLTGYKLTKNKPYWRYEIKKIARFESFNSKYIRIKRIKRISDIPKADYYIVGSDQVWNPQFYIDEKPELAKEIYLLTFTEPAKKVCFSPSFGIEQLPNEWISWFKEQLSTFLSFSVREEAGAKIIKELTNRDAIVTVDPTLMLNRESWNKIAEAPKNIETKKPYILTYFLSGKSNRINDDLKNYAENTNCVVYNLFDIEQPELYMINPSEFIYLTAHANLILTDSFHACIFSFLYGKPFLVYDRVNMPNMMSRMDTFFEKFNLRRKYVNSGLVNELLECDYSKGYEVLKHEQEIMREYLKKTMGIRI
ncbi:polysaccharide pyruvyl transferase family protein [uncultured Acetatifactor sp.]|uniref:polysaccharide pyruvyl transferase family protein n=1 Tax=uncultured Acetatifactor sp. TaxID=1671927 RepID=UPI002621909F|nr:polysaccharide pyruvyl transferase family protein [uncultured Acetatifactor sp.]